MEENGRVRDAMETVIEAFEQDNLEKVALAVFKGEGKPSDKWSFFNRLIMLMHDTFDARGFKQWKGVDRKVKKDAKAFHILGPVHKKVPVKKKSEEIDEDGEVMEVEEVVYVDKLVGFKPIPVFRYEDTEGEPLPEEDFQVDIPFEFNGIIEELGVKVRTTAFRYYYGRYNIQSKEIVLSSPELMVFLHELSHAVDDKLNGIEGGQNPLQEVVAEFSAAVIGYLIGYQVPLGNVRDYIEYYGFKELFRALNRVEKVVNYIIGKTRSTDEPRIHSSC